MCSFSPARFQREEKMEEERNKKGNAEKGRLLGTIHRTYRQGGCDERKIYKMR